MFFVIILLRIGKHDIEEKGVQVVAGVETRKVEVNRKLGVSSYGVLDCGAELMRLAWTGLHHKFSVRREVDPKFPEEAHTDPTVITRGPHRYPWELLTRNQVDLLVVDRGFQTEPPISYRSSPWENLVTGTPRAKRPEVVIEVCPPTAQLWERGLMNKACVTRWSKEGFQSHC